MMCLDGIVPVEIEGIPDLCVGYFWTIEHYEGYWSQRGWCVLSPTLKVVNMPKLNTEKNQIFYE